MTELSESQKEILAKITDVIVDVLGRDRDEITLDANFRDDLEADSLDLVELIMGFEDKFEIQEKISDEAVQDILTVGDAVTYIDDLMKQGD
jgi:acyl carrier protein